ncbi:MAG: DNA polymerase III subunit beta [Alicyclobacillaceae bacterium]|nr:DNA polymerase III subunit beta [Alicyclobacillaceae bacterium]
MRFQIRQPAIADVVQTVSKAVAVRTTKPVLTGILLELTPQSLTATAYDLELGIQHVLNADDENGLEILEVGSIVLPARYFTDVIRKLPGDTVSVDIQNNYMATIRSGSAEFHLHGIDAAEFPQLPVFRQAHSVQLPSRLLGELIRSTAFAASNLPVRPVLTGILFEFEAAAVRLTATDGLRLATRVASAEDASETPEWTSRSAILPGKSVLELLKILPDGEQLVTLQFTDTHSLFQVGDTSFYTRLIDGVYPDTKRLIPPSYRTEVRVQRELLHDAIDRAALIARDRENHMVRLEVRAEDLVVSSSSPEVGNVSEQVGVEHKSGDDLLIAFNARYVLEALRALPAGVVAVRLNGPNQPFVLTSAETDDNLQLISPVLIR